MLTGTVLLVLSSCKYEDGTREHGQWCGETADCVDEDLECRGTCLYPEGSRQLGESCASDDECTDESDNDVFIYCDEYGEGVCTTDSVGGNIVCNDGSVSPTCTECDAGCCSGHGGCE